MNNGIRRVLKKLVPASYWPQFVGFAVKARYGLFWLRYRGDAVECPFCRGRFARFLPDRLDIPILANLEVVGAGFASATCPRCHSTFRERLVYWYLKEKTGLFQDRLAVLHVAPELNLREVLAALPNLEYLSVDLSSPFAMARMDVTDLRFEDRTFDVAICNHVFEHVPADRRAMAEIYRVLKPGGWAVLQAPISLALLETYEDPSMVTARAREAAFGQADHVRIYACDYRERLAETGFLVEAYNFAGEFGHQLAERYGLQKEENVYIAVKPGERPDIAAIDNSSQMLEN